MSMSDLETAVRMKLRMCILVINDAAYGAEVHLYTARTGHRHRAVSRDGFCVDCARLRRARHYRAQAADLEPLRAWASEGASGVFASTARSSGRTRRIGTRAFSVIQVPVGRCSAVRVRSFTIHFDFPAKDNASARTAVAMSSAIQAI